MFHHLHVMNAFHRWHGIAMSAAMTLACACGGSSSETPWPAEPLDLEPGPAGEERVRGNVVDTKKLPDNYTKRQKELEKKKDASEKKQAAPPPAPAAPEPTPEPTPESTAPEPTPKAPESPPAKEE
jgi:hypothetical protein